GVQSDGAVGDGSRIRGGILQGAAIENQAGARPERARLAADSDGGNGDRPATEGDGAREEVPVGDRKGARAGFVQSDRSGNAKPLVALERVIQNTIVERHVAARPNV